MEVILKVNLEVDKRDDAENLKKLEHHAEYLLDLGSHPEISSVHDVQVSLVDEVNSKFPVKVFRTSAQECPGDLIERIDLQNPTVGEIIALLSANLPKDAKFYTSGCNFFSLYINRQRNYCTVDDSDSVFEEEE